MLTMRPSHNPKCCSILGSMSHAKYLKSKVLRNVWNLLSLLTPAKSFPETWKVMGVLKKQWHIQSLKVLFEQINFYNNNQVTTYFKLNSPLTLGCFKIINESSNWLQVTASFTLPKAQWEKSCSARYSPQDLWIKMHPKCHFSVSEVPFMISKIMGIAG